MEETDSESTYLLEDQRGFETIDLTSESRTSTILNHIDDRKKDNRPKGSTLIIFVS